MKVTQRKRISNNNNNNDEDADIKEKMIENKSMIDKSNENGEGIFLML